MVRFVGKLRAAAAEKRSHLDAGGVFAPPSLALLFRVPQLLQTLGVALGHGVDDGDDEVAHHDQHHLLKHPRQPVLIRWPTFSSMVQFVLLGFQVLTEGLLERWPNFRDRPERAKWGKMIRRMGL